LLDKYINTSFNNINNIKNSISINSSTLYPYIPDWAFRESFKMNDYYLEDE
jgi:hypothetical protein